VAPASAKRVARGLRGRWHDSQARERLLDFREERSRTPWPARRERPDADAPRVAIVVVNWNTRLLIAQLVFSIFRILGRDQVATIVVVDNGSTDGSRELLGALHDAGLIHLIANRRQRYHGPALNQGFSWLAERQGRVAAAAQIDYVWVLDSDVAVLHRDSVRDAVERLESEEAAVIGQAAWRPEYEQEMLGLFSLLIDPALAWKAPFPPFREHGDPSAAMQLALRQRGRGVVSFPYSDDGYLVHVGRGTLARVAEAAAGDNRYFAWAVDHNEPHWANASEGEKSYSAFLELFGSELPDVTAERLVAACRSDDLFTVTRAG
jgi:glycosyltransferase involved in cell wall biosynthesis